MRFVHNNELVIIPAKVFPDLFRVSRLDSAEHVAHIRGRIVVAAHARPEIRIL